MDERSAERGTLLHPAGQLPRKMSLKSFETDEGEQIARLGLIGRPLALKPRTVRLHDLQGQHDVRQRGPPRQQCRVLKRHPDYVQRPDDFPAAHSVRSPPHKGEGRTEFVDRAAATAPEDVLTKARVMQACAECCARSWRARP